MATLQQFEDLNIWQKARELAQAVYPLTFIAPIAQNFRYEDQLRGRVESIMDNIAEDFERGSRLEFINCLTISKGEVGEFYLNYIEALTTINFLPRNLTGYIL